MIDSRELKQQLDASGTVPPIALLEREAFEHNADLLFNYFPHSGVRMRIASKSLRCAPLLKQLLDRDREGKTISGLMAYRVSEAKHLVENYAARDILVAYPIASRAEATCLAGLQKKATVSLVVDSSEQVELVARAGRNLSCELPLVLDLNLAYKPVGSHNFQLGARRSPLATARDVRQIAEHIRNTEGVRMHGLMGYEAHHAAMPDSPQLKIFKRISRPQMEKLRAEVGQALASAGFTDLPLLNGGGSGSYLTTSSSKWINEVAVGSAFYKTALFDNHAQLAQFKPSLYFALQVVRSPGAGWATAYGGGYYASGGGAAPVLSGPEGLKITSQEGFGEVQTPIRDRDGKLAFGDTVICRPAKAGEPLERFNEIFPLEKGRLMEPIPTYRGEGCNFG